MGGLCICVSDWAVDMITNIYIDGFNLYHGAVKNTPYKWLDIGKMCAFLLPRNTIREIKYFTAPVKARPHDPQQPSRQQAYLRALKTIPNLKVIFGSFLTHEVEMPKANSHRSPPEMVKVIKTEEKGSDVNIATHLLVDGYEGNYEVAVVVSNDSDLIEPIRTVTTRLGKPVGVLYPHRRASRYLRETATFIKPIRPGVLSDSQFPAAMQDAIGSFHKPSRW